VTGQSFFTLAATAATISGVFLVFLGIEMALGVSGFNSFHLHNDKVNRGQPPGLILISSTDGLFYFGSTIVAAEVGVAQSDCQLSGLVVASKV
jgi:hypothetical protein